MKKGRIFFGKLACWFLGGGYSGIVDGASVFHGGFFAAVVFCFLWFRRR